MGVLINPKDRVKLSYFTLESGNTFIGIEKTGVDDKTINSILRRTC